MGIKTLSTRTFEVLLSSHGMRRELERVPFFEEE